MSKYITSKLDDKNYCVTNGQFTKHLRDNSLTYKEYYETYVTGYSPICPYCAKSRTFDQSNQSYGRTCGAHKCCALLLKDIRAEFTDEKNAAINAKRSATVFKEHGVEFITQTPGSIAKRKKFNQKIMEDGRTYNEHRQEKVRQIKLEKYGDQYFNNAAQIKVSKSLHTVERKIQIQTLRAATNLSIYGIENPLMLAGVLQKSAKGNQSTKPYILPSGKIVGIRGVENLALDLLFQKYKESEIRISDNYDLINCGVPVISYTDSYRYIRRYYPDIFIPEENKIIEVKSRWWYDGYGKDKYTSRLENNRRKRQACIDSGYLFEWWLFEVGNILKVIE